MKLIYSATLTADSDGVAIPIFSVTANQPPIQGNTRPYWVRFVLVAGGSERVSYCHIGESAGDTSDFCSTDATPSDTPVWTPIASNTTDPLLYAASNQDVIVNVYSP